ncbi:hypothetical protein LY78DRAFT_198980 [Colletotrichum sublineola]|nr:hypothetical protein LY78DRAFT_198980 [Colletotrichum sublineola]
MCWDSLTLDVYLGYSLVSSDHYRTTSSRGVQVDHTPIPLRDPADWRHPHSRTGKRSTIQAWCPRLHPQSTDNAQCSRRTSSCLRPSAMDTRFKAGPLIPDSAANPKSFDASILPREQQSLKTIPLLLSNFLSAMALGGDDATAVEEVISLLTEYGVQPCEGRGDPRVRSRW